MADRRTTSVAELEREDGHAAAKGTLHGASPKLIVPLGRGNTGKSVMSRWMCETAMNAGHPVVIADADRTNQTLSTYFSGVISPTSPDDYDVKAWLDALVEQQIENKLTIVLDLGGGDLVLKRHAAEMELVPFMEGNGIEVVAVHMIGPNLDDLAYLQDVEDDKTFAPERTILVLNEGLVPGARSERNAFEPIIQHSVFRAAVLRGAKVVRMPRLGCLNEIENRRLSFSTAEAGQTKGDLPPIGLVNRQRISLWLRAMQTAFAPVAHWLP